LEAKIQAKKAMKEEQAQQEAQEGNQLKPRPKKKAPALSSNDLLSAGLGGVGSKGKRT
jgi:hypothetical protein